MYQEKYFNNLEEIFNTQTYFLRNRVINVFDLVGHVKGKKILDIGTANGLFAIESAKKGATSIGLDFSKVALRNARKNTSNSLTNVEFVCAECSTLPFKSNIGHLELIMSWLAYFIICVYTYLCMSQILIKNC